MAQKILPYGQYEPHYKVTGSVKLGASSEEALKKLIIKRKKEGWLVVY